jgi:hypothetical protein
MLHLSPKMAVRAAPSLPTSIRERATVKLSPLCHVRAKAKVLPLLVLRAISKLSPRHDARASLFVTPRTTQRAVPRLLSDDLVRAKLRLSTSRSVRARPGHLADDLHDQVAGSRRRAMLAVIPSTVLSDADRCTQGQWRIGAHVLDALLNQEETPHDHQRRDRPQDHPLAPSARRVRAGENQTLESGVGNVSAHGAQHEMRRRKVPHETLST